VTHIAQVIVAERSSDSPIAQVVIFQYHTWLYVLFEIDGVTKISDSENQQPVLLYPHPRWLLERIGCGVVFVIFHGRAINPD
jgi:hypothetical protein